MASRGEKYKHDMIKDLVYTVDAVDKKTGMVYLKDQVVGKVTGVTPEQLKKHYTRQ